MNPWLQVTSEPERYIWPSVAHGVDLELPDEIAAELGEWPRPSWESTTPTVDLALPTESWFEVFDRRHHYVDLVQGAREGQISSVSDAVTSNIDLETLAIDVIDALDSPDDVATAWAVLTDLKIIDPTCGSGAFLFAALNILHRLYSAVFDCAVGHGKTSAHPGLAEIVASAERHPNRDYFLLKHAAINNLHGVDIMPEAVEIARLRLFLKLIAQVQIRADIEPLPDLEFNIRSGNILVGALDAESIRERVDMLNYPRVDELVTLADQAASAFESFAAMQISGGYEVIQGAKRLLEVTTTGVRQQLDRWWFESASSGQWTSLESYLASNSPFHWFIEFPGVFSKGGFDVLIGNPPYVAKTKISYPVEGFRTERCPDIYASCLERATQIVAPEGRLSMIVPMNLSWGGEYAEARAVLCDRFSSIWASTYDQMPSRLFEGVGTRNTIVLAGQDGTGVHTTSFNKWVSEFRPHLMATQRYIRHSSIPEPWPKVGHEDLVSLATGTRGGMRPTFLQSRRTSDFRLGYKKTANYWISVFVKDPPCLDGDRNPMPQKEVGDLYARSEEDILLALAVGASRIMFLWWIFTGDAFHVLGTQFQDFPIAVTKLSPNVREELAEIGTLLNERLMSTGDHLLWTPYAGAWYGNFDLTRCRDITSKVDEILIAALGLEGSRESIEVEYQNYMKSGGERPGTVRGETPDRDRT